MGLSNAHAKTHQGALLAGNRLHLQEGPIDLIIWADGEPGAVQEAYEAAERRFDGLLAELVAELPLLRAPLGDEVSLSPCTGVPSPLVGEGQGGGDRRTSALGVPPTPSPSPQGGAEFACARFMLKRSRTARRRLGRRRCTW